MLIYIFSYRFIISPEHDIVAFTKLTQSTISGKQGTNINECHVRWIQILNFLSISHDTNTR